MVRRRRTRRVLKWVVTVFCVSSFGLWLASGFYAVTWFGQTQRWIHGLSFQAGWLTIFWNDAPDQDLTFPPGWLCERHDFHLRRGWLPHRAPFIYSSSLLMIPGWYGPALLLLPTLLLWWRDRRRIPPGHCQKCGYNLTGNRSGRCPECGEPA